MRSSFNGWKSYFKNLSLRKNRLKCGKFILVKSRSFSPAGYTWFFRWLLNENKHTGHLTRQGQLGPELVNDIRSYHLKNDLSFTSVSYIFCADFFPQFRWLRSAIFDSAHFREFYKPPKALNCSPECFTYLQLVLRVRNHDRGCVGKFCYPDLNLFAAVAQYFYNH